MTQTALGFGVLGPLQMTVDGATVSLGTPKQRAVLAMLVINRNRPVGIESLINAAWEQWPPAEARTSLHSYVSNLRRLLGKAGADPRTLLVSAPPGYRLNVAETACDIGRFVIGKNAGVQAAAAGKFEAASTHLSAALAEWRGPVLDDLRDFQFVDAFSTALIEDKVLAHTALAEAEIACGRGYGVIGEYLAPLGVALGMTVLVTDPHKDVSAPGVRWVDFTTLLSQSDFVVCLAVATEETENLMNAAAFARMKPSAFFINMSRGNLVDEAALARALDDKRIAGAAMDVGRAADQMPSLALASRPDVLATPHAAGLTPQAIEHQAFDTVRQVAELVAGRMPPHAVNPDAATRLVRLRKA